MCQGFPLHVSTICVDSICCSEKMLTSQWWNPCLNLWTFWKRKTVQVWFLKFIKCPWRGDSTLSPYLQRLYYKPVSHTRYQNIGEQRAVTVVCSNCIVLLGVGLRDSPGMCKTLIFDKNSAKKYFVDDIWRWKMLNSTAKTRFSKFCTRDGDINFHN